MRTIKLMVLGLAVIGAGPSLLAEPGEDDALLTTRGIEFLHPHATRLLVIK